MSLGSVLGTTEAVDVDATVAEVEMGVEAVGFSNIGRDTALEEVFDESGL